MLRLDVTPGSDALTVSVDWSEERNAALGVIGMLPNVYKVRGRDAWLVPVWDFPILRADLNRAQVTQRVASPEALTLIQQYERWDEGMRAMAQQADAELSFSGLVLTEIGGKPVPAPYQRVGARFLIERKTAILGDDMGVGKSLQVAIALKHLQEAGKVRSVLLVTPASVKRQWAQETFKAFFGVNISHTVIDGVRGPGTHAQGCYKGLPITFGARERLCRGDRIHPRCVFYDRCAQDKKDFNTPGTVRAQQWSDASFVKIANYELLSRGVDPRKPDQFNDMEFLKREQIRFDAIVLDEGHRIRNGDTRWSQALQYLGAFATYRWVVSGTPLQNKLEDVFNICLFLSPNYLSQSKSRFRARHVVEDYWGNTDSYRNEEEVAYKVGNLMIRRTLKDVGVQLPEITEQDRYITLGKRQMAMYKQVRDALLSMDDLTSQVDIFDQERYAEDAPEIDYVRKETADGELLSVDQSFEQRVNSSNALTRGLFARELVDSTELLTPTIVESAKTEDLIEILSQIEPERKVIVFTNFKRMAKLLRRDIERATKRRPVLFTGDQSPRERELAKEKHRDDPSTQVMLLTSAGGEGLNLQHASMLIFFDLHWNPKFMRQVRGRVYRRGQVNHTTILRLIAEGTYEQRMMASLEYKEQLSNDVIERAVHWTRDEIMALL